LISLIGIIGTFSLVIVFFIYFIATFFSYLKAKHPSKLFFMGSFLSTVLTFFVWGLRVILLPQNEPNINTLLPYWTIAYIFAALYLVFLDFAIFELIGGEKKSIYIKLMSIIITILYIIVVIILIIGFDVGIVTFMDVTDLQIKNPFVSYFFLLLILFYLSIPNIFFILYLRRFPRTSKLYRKMIYIELRLFLFSFGAILDGARFPSNIGIFIARIIIMLGGIVMIIGFYYSKLQV